MTDHQFSLFPYKPAGKVPISAARIREAEKFLKERNERGVIEALRDIRYKLEDFEKRISNRRR